MQSYQLRNKAEDALFLSGQELSCPVAVSEKELTELKVGSKIILLLSGNKKYACRILDVTVSKHGKGWTGYIRIAKST